MRRQSLLVVVLAAAVLRTSISASGQQAPAAPQAPAVQVAPATAKPAPPERPVPQTTTNVKTEITITDQVGNSPPVTKTVSLIVADHESGQIRSEVTVTINSNTPIGAPQRVTDVELPLNADVRADVLESGRIRLRLGLNYRTATPATGPTGQGKSEVTENTTLVLESGKSTTISQSADAASDRKVTVELKATIIK